MPIYSIKIEFNKDIAVSGISQKQAFESAKYQQDDDNSQLVDMPLLYDHVTTIAVDPLQQSFHSNGSLETSDDFNPAMYKFNAQWFTIEDVDANSEEEAIEIINNRLENDYFDESDLRDVIINNQVNYPQDNADKAVAVFEDLGISAYRDFNDVYVDVLNDEGNTTEVAISEDEIVARAEHWVLPSQLDIDDTNVVNSSNQKSNFIEIVASDYKIINVRFGDSINPPTRETYSIASENDTPTTPESALALLINNSNYPDALSDMLEDENGVYVKDTQHRQSDHQPFELSHLPQDVVKQIFETPENYLSERFEAGINNQYAIPTFDRCSIDFGIHRIENENFKNGFKLAFDNSCNVSLLDEIDWQGNQKDEKVSFEAGYRVANLSTKHLNKIFSSDSAEQTRIWMDELLDDTISHDFNGLFGTFLKSAMPEDQAKELFNEIKDPTGQLHKDLSVLTAYQSFYRNNLSEISNLINPSLVNTPKL